MTSAVSDPSSSSISDDVFSCSSDHDANNDNEIMTSPRTPDEHQHGDELECKLTCKANYSTNEKSPPDSQTASANRESDDVGNDAIVRVQPREGQGEGSEGEATFVAVADLAQDVSTLATVKVEAMPVSHHFYNQWARAPRAADDTDGDVINSTHKNSSTRMFTATGSLKSYALMNAIVRDKQSPFQCLADLFQSNFTAHASPEHTVNDEKHDVLERSLSDAFVTTGTPVRFADCGSQTCEQDSLPEISNSAAKASLGDENSYSSISEPLVSVISRNSPGSIRLLSDIGFEKRRLFSQVTQRRWPSQSSSSSSSSFSGSRSAPLARSPQTALSMKPASLLFPSSIDMRDVRYRRVDHKHPRAVFIRAQPQQAAETSNKHRPTKGASLKLDIVSGSVLGSSRNRELTRVEFIDFSDAKQGGAANSPGRRENERLDPRRKSGAEGRSAKACIRPLGIVDRHRQAGMESQDRLHVHQQFLTVGMTLPVRACDDWHS